MVHSDSTAASGGEVPFILKCRVCVGLASNPCAFPDPNSMPVSQGSATWRWLSNASNRGEAACALGKKIAFFLSPKRSRQEFTNEYCLMNYINVGNRGSLHIISLQNMHPFSFSWTNAQSQRLLCVQSTRSGILVFRIGVRTVRHTNSRGGMGTGSGFSRNISSNKSVRQKPLLSCFFLP